MIAAPRLFVVGKHMGGDFANSRIPGRAVPIGVSHDDVGGGVEVGAGVQRVGGPCLTYGGAGALVVEQSGQPRGEFAFVGAGIGGSDNALRLAALLIDVHARPAEGVGARAAPVGVLYI